MSLRDLGEWTGTLDVLLILLKNGTLAKNEITIELKRSGTTAQTALKVLKRAGLITEVEADAFPYRKDVSLTDRGRRVADHLLEIEKILAEKQ